MTSKDCLVCATDEGLFLDVFTHGKDFRDIIQNFLSLELQKNKPSTKICYKCAYELTECSKFVDKFNKVHQNKTQRLRKSGYCGLCQEPGRKGFIYELRNDTLQNVFKQIHDVFHRDLSSTFRTLHVCLYCRYNLDVLVDLKKVAENHSLSDHTNLAKVDVKVIKRKTTTLLTPPLFLNASDIDKSVHPIMKKKSSKISPTSPINDRQCDTCESKVEHGAGMYRFHHTGQTVCKDCWVVMEPNELSKRSKKNIMESSTKRCSVFLKDVLSNPPEYTSEDSKQSKGPMRTEKDSAGNLVYIVSDDSEVESSPKRDNKGTKRASSENDTKSTKKTKRLFEPIPRRETRATSVMSNVSTASTSSRAPPKRRHSDNFEIPESEPKRLRSRAKKVLQPQQDDESKVIKPVRSTRTSKISSPLKIQSSSDESAKSSKRNSKLSESRDRSYSPPLSRASSTSSLSRKDNSQDEETVDVPETTRRSKRVKNSKKSDDKTQELLRENDERIKKSKKNIKKEKLVDSKKTLASPSESLSPKSHEEVRENDEENEKIIKNDEKSEIDADNQSYTCTICCTEFETKVEGMTHELTHSKKLEVVLEKVLMSDDIKDEVQENGINENDASIKIDSSVKSVESSAVDTLEVTEDTEVSKENEKPKEDEATSENVRTEEEASKAIAENDKDEQHGETPKDNKKDEEKVEEEKQIEDPEVSEEVNDKETSSDVDKAREEENGTEEKTSEESLPAAVDEKSKGEEEEKEEEEERENEEDSKQKESVVEDEDKGKNDKEESVPNETSGDEKKNEEINAIKSEDDKLSQELSTDSEKPSELHEDGDKHLMNDDEKQDSVKQEDEASKPDEDDKVSVNEGKVDGDEECQGEKNTDEAQADEDKVEDNEKQEVKGGECEVRETDDESDEEKSPEPEPLSPVPPILLDNVDNEQKLSEEQKIDDDVIEVNRDYCNESDETKEFDSNSHNKSTEITNGEDTKTNDVDLASESLKKTTDIDIDDASMDAIEKQMKTIVGVDEEKDQNNDINKNDSDDSKEITDMSLLDSANEVNRKVSQ